ncbi:putative armadillo-like helical, condensin subunit 1/Condensin-2 complex subunit D3 [Helianthus annuus]|nr:putative armadillo-like helical, condensin subunit 1/Condensin-2 complex subunit D3 [Helianthus annuus]
MEEAINQIVTELEHHHHHHHHNPQSQTPITQSTLQALQTLLDYTINKDDPLEMENLSDELSSKNLSLSTALLPPLTAAMDSGGPHHSLLASKVYLSLLLTKNFPVISLFNPVAFHSLLRTIRSSFKNSQVSGSSNNVGRKKKGGGRVKNRGKNVILGDDEDEREQPREFDIRVLFPVLERLHLVLGLIHLDRFPDCLKGLVQTMAAIPATALESCAGSGLSNYSKLCNLCAEILSELLKSEHGDKGVNAGEVLKSLSSSILLSKSQARTFGLSYVVNKMAVMAKGSDEIRKAMVNFPKYLIGKAPERAELRALAVESILEVVRCLEYEDQIAFSDYVVKMTRGKPQFRLLAVDLIYNLIMSLNNPLGHESSWGVKCLQVLLERCSDSTAGIRARAITNLAQLVGFLSANNENKTELMKIMGFGEDGGINDLLRKRCVDEKAAVRKSALVLISKLTALQGDGGGFDDMLLKIMGVACSDQLVSIRKAAISALSETFRKFDDENVTKEWLHSVPRLITDNETSIQEECENLFLELVLDRVSRAGSNVDDLSLSDGVLSLLKEICNGEVSPWVKKICTNLGKKKKLKPRIAVSLQNIIKKSESTWLTDSKPIEKWLAPPGAWFLLSEVSGFLLKAVDWEFLYHHWQLLDKHESSNTPIEEEDIESNSVDWAGDRVFLLQTISNVSVELPAEAAADLAHNLLKRIEDFSMHSMEVDAHVKALRTLCKRKAKDAQEADALVIKWVHQLLSKASKALQTYMTKNLENNKNNSLFTPPSGTRKGNRSSTTISKLLAQATTAVYTVGSLVLVCPAADLKTIVPILHNVITSGVSDPKHKKSTEVLVSFKQTAPSLYIQAWVAMGKICLADGKLAKQYIPLFVQEMEKSDIASLRNNIVVMMTDLCVRYTALVDCYIPNITKCLRDPCELVRRQTFTLLCRLLQRDYVKWRGVVFLRFLLSLVDESEKIRQLADFLFGNILKVKAPLLAYNSFVEAIFVLNDCNAHTGQSNPLSSQKESRLFSIRGNDEKSRSQRMHIYVSLLKQMAPEHLLATFAKVCAEILASASDGMLKIEDVTSQSVLQDAFRVLSCKEIKIPTNKGSSTESSEMEEDVTENAIKGRVITQVVKKSLIQNTIPIFIELKRLLESKNSRLTGSLMECLRILLKDYKNEIEEMLVADKQLQKELIYDMQKYELQKARSTAAEAVDKGVNVNMQTSSKVSSAVAGVKAEATAKSVLRDVNQGAGTPSLSAMNVPKLKSSTGGAVKHKGRSSAVLESLRRRQSFDLDDES